MLFKLISDHSYFVFWDLVKSWSLKKKNSFAGAHYKKNILKGTFDLKLKIYNNCSDVLACKCACLRAFQVIANRTRFQLSLDKMTESKL